MAHDFIFEREPINLTHIFPHVDIADLVIVHCICVAPHISYHERGHRVGFALCAFFV